MVLQFGKSDEQPQIQIRPYLYCRGRSSVQTEQGQDAQVFFFFFIKSPHHYLTPPLLLPDASSINNEKLMKR